MEIGDLLKLMKKESEIVTSFLKEPPQGGVN
jgi:hypothetical protein